MDHNSPTFSPLDSAVSEVASSGHPAAGPHQSLQEHLRFSTANVVQYLSKNVIGEPLFSRFIGKRSRFYLFMNVYESEKAGGKWKIVLKFICPRSSDLFCVVNYYIKWVTTSWTHSTINLFIAKLIQDLDTIGTWDTRLHVQVHDKKKTVLRISKTLEETGSDPTFI